MLAEISKKNYLKIQNVAASSFFLFLEFVIFHKSSKIYVCFDCKQINFQCRSMTMYQFALSAQIFKTLRFWKKVGGGAFPVPRCLHLRCLWMIRELGMNSNQSITKSY